jgi:HK97 family phage portal protein
MKNKTLFFDGKGIKSVDIWGDNLDGWTVLSGDGAETADSAYYKLIPTLYRAVQIISYSISSMPFALMKGKTEYDTSKEWENKIGFMPNPYTLLQMIASSLEIAGNCYLFRERSVAMTKALNYCLPTSVKAEIDKAKHEVKYFERAVNNIPTKFGVDDFVYFWLPDPYVELGPAKNYPAKAAADACGVLLNMDLFAANFFEHGAVKVTLLTVTGMPAEAERQKLSDWWKRVVSGVKNAFGAQVINADAIKPIVIGEGIKELENVTIGEEKREDIAIALGIPMSILFANAANYATSQQDELNFLNQTIIPLCTFIESILNEQIFKDLGLEWHFLPETLDAMQEDEVARSQALKIYVDIGFTILQACEIVGVELTDKIKDELIAAEAEKKRRAEELAKQMAAKPEPQPGQPDESNENPNANSENTGSNTNSDTTFKSELDKINNKAIDAMIDDMNKWKIKVLNELRKGNPMYTDFTMTVIPKPMRETIISALGKAKDENDVNSLFDEIITTTLQNSRMGNDVKDAFSVTQSPKPVFGDSIMVLARALDRATDALERTE